MKKEHIQTILKICEKDGHEIGEIYEGPLSYWAEITSYPKTPGYVYVIAYLIDLERHMYAFWKESDVEEYKASDQIIWRNKNPKPAAVCTCDISILVNVGCQCGSFQQGG